MITESSRSAEQIADDKRKVIFYFDTISPYAWLASKELARIQAAGLQVECQPILFAALLNANGQKGPAEIPAKRANFFRDVMRMAARKGHAFAGAPHHPYNPLKALRLCIAVDDIEARNCLSVALLAATWEYGQDLNDAAVLQRMVEECGLAHLDLVAQIDRPEIKEKLNLATLAAIDAQIFGVPSFVLNGEIFWGCDRVDDLLWYHAGNRIDQAVLEDCLARPSSAQRKQS
ncbi:MAG: DsbA family protein [Undibacterium sp.]|nr:DsbA family protein [Undibacterium sp.]